MLSSQRVLRGLKQLLRKSRYTAKGPEQGREPTWRVRARRVTVAVTKALPRPPRARPLTSPPLSTPSREPMLRAGADQARLEVFTSRAHPLPYIAPWSSSHPLAPKPPGPPVNSAPAYGAAAAPTPDSPP